jgi:hypothetical protein
MIITYGNYKIEGEGNSFTLYIVNKEKEKVLGYFTSMKHVLQRLVTESKGPKRKGKPDLELIKLYKQHVNNVKKLNYISNIVYNSINVIDAKINGIRKV